MTLKENKLKCLQMPNTLCEAKYLQVRRVHLLLKWNTLCTTLCVGLSRNYSKKSVWQGFSNDLFSFKLFTSLIDKY
jgi:hypothetical protein